MKSNKSVPTIQDVAREAGVSPSTVSNVLNRRWRQTSKETRERILEVARRLNYQPNAMAAALRRRSTRTIGVIVTSILNPFYTAVVRGIQDEARRNGYAVEDGEAAIGDAGIAAPVFDRDGVVGAIGLIGPVERLLAAEARDGHAVAVRETAKLLSRDLGGGRSTPRRFVA